MHGVYVSQLRLPAPSTIGLLLRDGEPVPVTPNVRLQSRRPAAGRRAGAGAGGDRAAAARRRAAAGRSPPGSARAGPPATIWDTEPVTDAGPTRIRRLSRPGRPRAPCRPCQPPRQVALLAIIAASVVLLDLLTKIIAVAMLTPGESPSILGGLVYFSLIRNPGAAFSMATGMTWMLALVAIAVVVVIIRMAPRLRSTPWAVVARPGAGRRHRQPDRPDLPLTRLPAGPCRRLRLGVRPERRVLPDLQRRRLGDHHRRHQPRRHRAARHRLRRHQSPEAQQRRTTVPEVRRLAGAGAA